MSKGKKLESACCFWKIKKRKFSKQNVGYEE